MSNIDLNKYKDFVQSVTSKESNILSELIGRINDLDAKSKLENSSVNVSLLITSSFGLSSETGEFNEIVKKILFQGKPLTEDNLIHMKKELGDVIWYWMNACRSLNLDPNDVISENVKKLESRYPGGKFDPFYSENRKEGDL